MGHRRESRRQLVEGRGRRLRPGIRRALTIVAVICASVAVLTVLAAWERGWECVRTAFRIDVSEGGGAVSVTPACA